MAKSGGSGLGGRRGDPRAIARARLLVTPMFMATAFLQPDAEDPGLLLLALLACVWVAATAVPVLRGGPRRLPRAALIGGDLMVLGAGGLLTDGSYSLYPFIALLGLCAMPPVLALRYRLTFYGAFAVCVGGPVLWHNVQDGGFPRGTLSFALGLGIAYVLATRGSESERRYVAALDALLERRSKLLTDASALAEEQRRRASHELHDAVLQTLLAAGQDLQEAALTGESEEVAHARGLVSSSITALRSAVTGLHPVSLAGAKLPSALAALVQYHRDHGAVVISTVDPGAHGPHDDALFTTARELLADAVGRADGRPILVRLGRQDDEVVLEISAESGAMNGYADQTAMGLVAISWAAERLRDAGGSLELHHGDRDSSRATAPRR